MVIPIEALAKEAYQVFVARNAERVPAFGSPPTWEQLPWYVQGVWCDVVRKVLELAKPAIL